MSPFAKLLGQPQAIELLTQAIAQNRVAPAYLFAGPPGVGRGLAAFCFTELLFSTFARSPQTPERLAALPRRLQQRNHPDFLWVEPTYLHQGKRLSATEALSAGLKRRSPPQIRLEQVREITQFLSRAPLEAPRSIVVLEDAETMAEAAANGLLKTLEEPGQATLILIAPGAETLLPTLVSRCQRIPFFGLPPTVMAEVLQQTGHAEILSHPKILALAQGSPGAAIASWQQLQSIPEELLQALQQPIASLRTALELARQIDKQLDLEAQLWLVDYLQQLYWNSSQAPLTAAQGLHQLEQARQFLLSYAQPRLVWEVTLMRLGQLAMSGILQQN